MKANATKDTLLRDGWTHDPDYRRCYQTQDDVETILTLLALDRESTLVDIGCGNGAFAIAAAQKNPGCRVWASDALDSAVAECKAKAGQLPNLHAEVAWAHSIPLTDSSVDRALCRSVLHHIAEPQAVYAEISRLLKPGGRLVLQTPCNYWEAAFEQVLSGIMMLADDTHRRFYYQPAEIVTGLQAAGFRTKAPECWTYPFPFIDDPQARFIQQHQAEERLRLRPIEPGKWSIENYWTRIIAEKPLEPAGAPKAPVDGTDGRRNPPRNAMQALHFARYQPEHREQMLALHRGAIEGFALGMSQQEDEADLLAIEQVYTASGGEFLIGVLDGRVVAMGGFERLSDTTAELRRMRIQRGLQGRGLGTQLLQELEGIAFDRGVRTLTLETAKARPLTPEFYRKHGYLETGTGFYGRVETIRFAKTMAAAPKRPTRTTPR